MSRSVTRRDFLDGVLLSGAAALAGGSALGALSGRGLASRPQAPYPPALGGLRGSHEGSYEAAHALRDGSFWAKAGAPEPTGERYDLVVVGAGISGLAAAYFFRKRRPQARVLILDNHDDFGGHARRNEWRAGGRLLLGYGGAQSLENPGQYSDVAKGLLRDLGVEPRRFETAYDRTLYQSLGLAPGVFFDRETFGADRLVAGFGTRPWEEFLAESPLAGAARREVQRVFESREDFLAGIPEPERRSLLAATSYADYLTRYARLPPAALPLFQAMSHDSHGVGIDAVPALECASLRVFVGGLSEGLAYPGFAGTALGEGAAALGRTAQLQQHEEPYIYHFPDGNAAIARLLVRALVPGAAPGSTMEDVVPARFRYDRLDRPGAAVRVRLSSTCVRLRHRGEAASAAEVELDYARGRRVYRASARQAVLACWHGVIPHIAPELSEQQKEALAYGVKVPLVYTNVVIRDWGAFVRAGVCEVYAPGSFHTAVSLDFPVGLGGYRFPARPDEPAMLHLLRTPCSPGLPARDQHRAGRVELLSTPFAEFEGKIREQLARMLGDRGFEPERDILGITVNRWPHGYAYEYNSLFDPEWPPGQEPCARARRRLGRIAIANSDGAASAYLDAAVDEAHRAVEELLA